MPVEYDPRSGRYYSYSSIRTNEGRGPGPSLLRDPYAPAARNAYSNLRWLDEGPRAAPTPKPPTGPQPGDVFDWSKAIDEYGRSGFASNLLPDDLARSYIDRIVSEQGSGLLGALSGARARGQISGLGFDAAMRNYESQRQAALGQVGQLGQGLIGGYRQELQDILGQARTDIGRMTTEQKGRFQLDPYKQRIGTRAGELRGGLEAALRNAVGGTQYFTEAPAFSAAASSQGVFNRPGSELLASLERERRNTSTRGLGDRGEF